MERVIQRYLKDKHLQTPLTNQHAFTKGRSCDTALSTVTDTVEKAALRGQYCLAVFLDIQGAFDNLTFASIDREMRALTVRPDIVEWYGHLLQNR